jgi:hypothetical protein
MKKWIFLLAVGLSFASCEEIKDAAENNNNNSTSSSPDAQYPVPDGVSAALVALNTTTTVSVPVVGDQTVIQGTAVARFFGGPAAGEVTCEGETLEEQGDAYLYIPDVSDTEGISFSAPIEWSVSGGADVSAFSHNVNGEVPELGALSGDSDGEVDLSQDLALSIDVANSNLSMADSILYVLIDKEGTLYKRTVAASQTSITINAGAMNDLVTGQGYLQANAFTYDLEDINGSTMAFIRQGSNTKLVDFK